MTMNAKAYNVLRMAVEDGVSYGVRRYYKHRDGPEESVLVEMSEEIAEHVINEICEWFEFRHEPYGGQSLPLPGV